MGLRTLSSPQRLAARDAGVVVRTLEFDPNDCTLDPNALSRMVHRRTRLVAITHASNAVGTIVNLRPFVDVAHRAGALVYVDAVHCAPHFPIDVRELDCDFLACSAYKFFGPHLGVMYGKGDLLAEVNAYKVRPAPDSGAGRWETGTQNFEGIVGLSACLDYIASIGEDGGPPEGLIGVRLSRALKCIREHEFSLSERFLDGTRRIDGLRILGISEPERVAERTPTFGIVLTDRSSKEFAERLCQRGIFVGHGSFYAIAVTERLGIAQSGGLVRIGFVHYNTAAEVDRLVEALGEISRG